MSTEQIERELLRLPAYERARLAARPIASLDEDAEVDRAWVEEVRRRDEELDFVVTPPFSCDWGQKTHAEAAGVEQDSGQGLAIP